MDTNSIENILKWNISNMGKEKMTQKNSDSTIIVRFFKSNVRDFLGGPVVKNLPCNGGDVGSILSRGTKTPHAAEQLSPVPQALSPHATTSHMCHMKRFSMKQ